MKIKFGKVACALGMLVIGLTFGRPAWSADLVQGGTITAINAATSNADNFYVIIQGGTGPCVGPSVAIYFYESKAGNVRQFNRAFMLATLAYTLGKKVWIYNYTDNSCNGASFITISE